MDGLDILTFSGWSRPADALRPLAPSADTFDYFDAGRPDIRAIAAQLPRRDYDLVIGWSLGGVLARRLLQTGHLRARAFVSLSAPLQFVRDTRVRDAMPPETFERFYTNYRDDPARTAARFHGLLVKNDRHHRRILGELTHHPRVQEADAWLRWMDFLATYSALDHRYDALPPSLLIHGAGDAIVPVAQAYHLSEHLGAAALHVLPHCGHAPHHHDPDGLRRRIAAFYEAHAR